MDQALMNKLKYMGGRAAVAHKPEGWPSDLESADKLTDTYAFLLVFAGNAQEVRERVNKAIPHLEEDAVFWLAYPKKSSGIKTDVNRDVIWRMVDAETDYTLVSNVSLDDTWSALRLRRKDKTLRK